MGTNREFKFENVVAQLNHDEGKGKIFRFWEVPKSSGADKEMM